MNLLVAGLVVAATLSTASGCCSFNGLCYPAGHIIKGICFILKCEAGKPNFWSNIEFRDCGCKRCLAENGGNIDQFKTGSLQIPYDCTYILVHSSSPSYSVTSGYGSPTSCSSPPCILKNRISILGLNIYFYNNNPGSLVIDGNTFSNFGNNPTPVGSYPLLAWDTWNGCIALQGTVGLSVLLCPNAVYIYTSDIGGLKGYCVPGTVFPQYCSYTYAIDESIKKVEPLTQ